MHRLVDPRQLRRVDDGPGGRLQVAAEAVADAQPDRRLAVDVASDSTSGTPTLGSLANHGYSAGSVNASAHAVGGVAELLARGELHAGSPARRTMASTRAPNRVARDGPDARTSPASVVGGVGAGERRWPAATSSSSSDLGRGAGGPRPAGSPRRAAREQRVGGIGRRGRLARRSSRCDRPDAAGSVDVDGGGLEPVEERAAGRARAARPGWMRERAQWMCDLALGAGDGDVEQPGLLVLFGSPSGRPDGDRAVLAADDVDDRPLEALGGVDGRQRRPRRRRWSSSVRLAWAQPVNSRAGHRRVDLDLRLVGHGDQVGAPPGRSRSSSPTASSMAVISGRSSCGSSGRGPAGRRGRPAAPPADGGAWGCPWRRAPARCATIWSWVRARTANARHGTSGPRRRRIAVATAVTSATSSSWAGESGGGPGRAGRRRVAVGEPGGADDRCGRGGDLRRRPVGAVEVDGLERRPPPAQRRRAGRGSAPFQP